MPIFYGPTTIFLDREFVPLALDTTDPSLPKATYENDRDLFKVEIESLPIEHPTNAGTFLEDASLDIIFPSIRDGNQGVIKIVNKAGDTQLNLDSFIVNNQVVGNVFIEKEKTTLLEFTFTQGVYFFRGSAELSSVAEKGTVSLNVKISGDDKLGNELNSFRTPNGALAWAIKNASFVNDDIFFSTDTPREILTINIYAPEPAELAPEQSGEFETTLHLPDAPNLGIKIIGINNSAGSKPVINATSVTSQFNRCLYSRNSRYITIENIHFKNDAMLCVITRNSEINLIDCTFESTATSPTTFFLSFGYSNLKISGLLELISSSNVESRLFWANKFSELVLSNVVGTSTGNRNAGLSIVATGIKFDQILDSDNNSTIKIDDYLDGETSGVPRYVQGSIFSDNPTNKIGFNSRINNESSTFP